MEVDLFGEQYNFVYHTDFFNKSSQPRKRKLSIIL